MAARLVLGHPDGLAVGILTVGVRVISVGMRVIIAGVPVVIAVVGPVRVAGAGQLAVRVDQARQHLDSALHVALVLQHDVDGVGEHVRVELADAEDGQGARPVDRF